MAHDVYPSESDSDQEESILEEAEEETGTVSCANLEPIGRVKRRKATRKPRDKSRKRSRCLPRVRHHSDSKTLEALEIQHRAEKAQRSLEEIYLKNGQENVAWPQEAV